jgi:hypothetical protein
MNNKLNESQLESMMSMMSQPTNNSKSLTYFEVLSLILFTLKCIGTITCSWIVPFIPLFIPFVFYILIVFIGFLKAKFFNKK